LTCHQFQQRLFKIRAFYEMIGILPSEAAFSREQSGFPGRRGEPGLRDGSDPGGDTGNVRLFPGTLQDIARRLLSTSGFSGD
jgi:hypothetical protein